MNDKSYIKCECFRTLITQYDSGTGFAGYSTS